MSHKDTWLIRIYDTDHPELQAWGECALFAGLSDEDDAGYTSRLAAACDDPEKWLRENRGHGDSSIIFGIESALANFRGKHDLWHSGQMSIPVNGLVWMGDKHLMAERIRAKLDQGFRCLKLKIGGIDFEDEIDLLAEVRRRFSPDYLQIRLDANGAFSPNTALERLERLSHYHIHSIEQPIKARQWEHMAHLCRRSPIDIALDEELIPLSRHPEQRAIMLDTIRPRYIILKPSLCGGFAASDHWISLAESMDIGWWATSALESNIGLDAIAGWLTDRLHANGTQDIMPQGLGTGSLYDNNIPSRLVMKGQYLTYDTAS